MTRSIMNVLSQKLKESEAFEIQVTVDGMEAVGGLMEVGSDFILMKIDAVDHYIPIAHIQSIVLEDI